MQKNGSQTCVNSGREYFNAKRELANTTRIRDTILLRVMQEEVDLELDS